MVTATSPETAAETDSLSVKCPHCGAKPGQACFGGLGNHTPTHRRRHDAEERALKKAARTAAAAGAAATAPALPADVPPPAFEVRPPAKPRASRRPVGTEPTHDELDAITATGGAAEADGYPIDANPYPEGADLARHARWHAGWGRSQMARDHTGGLAPVLRIDLDGEYVRLDEALPIARERGRQAFARGVRRKEDPHFVLPALVDEWRAGWDEASNAALNAARQDSRDRPRYLAPNMDVAREGAPLIIPLPWIRPSPLNPRKRFDEAALKELADSITRDGLLEPVVVRPIADADTAAGPPPYYELVAGERRWRACGLAELDAIPAMVRHDLGDADALRLALIENLVREDLDPIEEAGGYRQLGELGMRQREIAERVNRSQPAVANALRLLALPDDIQQRISARELSPSHGIALASYKEYPKLQSQLAVLAAEHKWPSSRLEDGKALFGVARVRRLSSVQEIGWSYGAPFDVAVCKKCPFGAFRRTDSYGEGVCLKPEHYRELEREAQERRRAAEEQRQADLRRRAEEQAVAAAAAAPAKVKGGKGPGAGSPTSAADAVPTLDALEKRYGYGNVYEFRGASDRPAGCAADVCPCAAICRKSGDTLIEVCTDRSRRDLLQRRQAIAANKAKRLTADELGKRAAALVAGLYWPADWLPDSPASRALTLVLYGAMTGREVRMNGKAGHVWEESLARLGTDGTVLAGTRHPAQYGASGHWVELEQFAQLPPTAQLRLALDVITQDDAVRANEVASPAKLAAFFAGEAPAEESPIRAFAYAADGQALGERSPEQLQQDLAAHAALTQQRGPRFADVLIPDGEPVRVAGAGGRERALALQREPDGEGGTLRGSYVVLVDGTACASLEWYGVRNDEPEPASLVWGAAHQGAEQYVRELPTWDAAIAFLKANVVTIAAGISVDDAAGALVEVAG